MKNKRLQSQELTFWLCGPRDCKYIWKWLSAHWWLSFRSCF